MATKLLIFENICAGSLEDELNPWLAQHPNVMPEDVRYQLGVTGDGAVYHVAAVVYEDMAANGRKAA